MSTTTTSVSSDVVSFSPVDSVPRIGFEASGAVVPFGPGGFTVDTGADAFTDADGAMAAILSGDPATYDRLVSELRTKKGKPTARHDVYVRKLVAGAQLADARVAVAALNADAYREITAAVLMAGGETRETVASLLNVSKSRVSQLGKVGTIIMRTGSPDGYTLAELREVASSTGAKALTEVLASEGSAKVLRNKVATVVHDGMRKREENKIAAAARKAADKGSNVTGTGVQSDTADAPADVTPADDDVTPDTADDTAATTPEESTSDASDLGSDVSRMVQLLTDARNLAPVLAARGEELTKAQRKTLNGALGKLVDGVAELADIIGQ